MRKRLLVLGLTLQLMLICCARPAMAGYATLRPGKAYSEDVKTMQAALISLGFLGGTPDGIFGNNTENAVRKFQRKYHLNVDGLAGNTTLTKLYSLTGKADTSVPEASDTKNTETTETETKNTVPVQTTPAPTVDPSVSDRFTSTATGLFGGNYATLRFKNRGERVRQLQQALISLKYLSGRADGIFGSRTRLAVIAFQKANGLTADGLAGKRTLLALEKALTGSATTTTTTTTTAAPTAAPTVTPTAAPNSISPGVASTAVGIVKLLHWYDDVKPALKTGQNLQIVDPTSGISWTLRLYSLGRHADAEPLTADDTAAMLKAFGGKNTWNQKAVYVKLPDGTWTIGSTHDMPHMSGSIDDNNFNGHLCVHFLRDMDECKENDPNYGVSNQNTIRSFWKNLTGVEIP